MMRWLPLIFLIALACNGPDASDVAICRDYVHRVCEPDLCDAVVPLVTSADTCETQMLKKSGCDNDNFAFTTNPTRADFLNCRLPIIRAGDNISQHPNCDDVSESFELCPQVVAMFNPDGGT
jgi:hypothetical protein